MAKKTPLSFLIEVQSKEALKKLEEVEQKLGKLKDGIQIDITATSGNNLLTLLENIKTAAETIKNVKDAIKNDSFNGFANRVSKAVEAVNNLNGAFNTLNQTIGANEGLKNFMVGLGEVIRAARSAVTQLSATSSSATGGSGSADAEAKKILKSIEQAKYEYYKIENLIQRASNASAAGKMFGDTSKLDEQIRKLEQYKTTLDELRRTGKKGDMDTITFKAQGDYKIIVDDLKKLVAEQERVNKKNEEGARSAQRNADATQQAAHGVRALTAEEQRLSQALSQTVGDLNKQSQILSDLKSMAAQYLSIYAGQQFLNNIIEIGGQLEMQRLSIGAILQDTAQANVLFNQIKGLALQSPFGVVELDQFTKQLSAYGFQYNELFEMTKRLADISAGAGTDVSRLALALGHVRAEGALTGYTLRQFAMNNIPMVGKLSERLSELEGRLVTVAEVRKRVSKKEIDYSMVEDVIKELTDEGGMFFDMQEVISGSVKAKWKNLRDAFDIMYGEMAESAVGGALKGLATTLTELAKRWKEIGTVVMSVAAVYGSAKAYMLLYNSLLGKQATAVFGTIAAERQSIATKLHLATAYRSLTSAEQSGLITSQRLTFSERARLMTGRQLTAEQRLRIIMTQQQRTADLSLAMSEGRLTTEELARSVALGRVSKAQARAVIMTSTLTKEAKAQGIAVINNVRTWGMFTGVINGSAMAVTRLGVALKGLLLNPTTWIFALIAGITDLWSRNNDEMERATELSKSISEKASEGIKNIQTMMQETGMSLWKDGTAEWLDPDKMDSDAMIQTMDTWEEFIKNYSATKNEMLNQAHFNDDGSVKELEDQYNSLADSVAIVSQAYNHLGEVSEMVEDAIKATNGGWFNDDILTNLKDWTKQTKRYESALVSTAQNYGKYLNAGLEAAKGDKVFAEAMKSANKEMQEKHKRELTATEQLDLLLKNQNKYNSALERFKNASALSNGDDILSSSGITQAFTQMRYAESEVVKDTDLMVARLKTSLKEAGFRETSEEYRQIVLLALGEIAAKAEGTTDDIQKRFKELAATKFSIQVDAETAEAYTRIGLLQEELNALVAGPDGDGSWTIDIKGVVNGGDIIQKCREAYKKAKDSIENMKPVMIKMGVSLDMAKSLTDEQIDKLAGDSVIKKMFLKAIRDAYRDIDQVTKASKEYGFSLSDPNPGGKVFKDKKDKASSGNKEDKELKHARTLLEETKAFLQEYKKYRETYSKEKSISLLEDLFPTTKGKGQKIVDNYKEVLRNIKGSLNLSTEERKKFGLSIDKLIADTDYDNLKKKLDDAGKEMQNYISQHADQFNLFKQILEKTGNTQLAGQALIDGRIWDDAARTFAEKLKELSGETSIDYTMSETDAEKHFKQIAGGYDLWKKIVDLTRDNYVQALTKASDAVADALTNQQKIAILQDKIREAENDTKSGIDHSAEIAKWREEISKLESEMFEFLPIYEKIFGDRTYKGYNAVKDAENLANTLIEHAKPGAKDPKTGKTSYYSTYYMDGEEIVKVTMTRQQLEKLKKTLDNFHKDEVKKNPFASLYDDIKDLYDTLKNNDASVEEKGEAWKKFGESLSEVSKIVGNFAGELSSMFDALGNDSLAEAMSDVQASMDSINNIANGFAQGGIVGGIVAGAGEAVKWIGRIAQKHDTKLDKAIQKSQREVKKLTNEYKNLADELDRRLTGIYGGEEYTQMFENYNKQLKELESQRENESAKKKKDKDKLLDYDQQIKEMRDNIKYFAEDMAKELYNIDIKSWAQELTDAVVDAWVKGEDAAEAWHDKVMDLVKDVTKNIIAQKIVEAALKPALDFITSEMTAKGGKLDEGSITQMAKMLEEAGMTSVGNIEVMLEALKRAGYDLSEAGKSSSSASSSIKNITEETADLLVSYVNAIRADVSVIRELQTRGIDYISEVPTISITAQAQLQQLNIISENTRRNADYANEINDLIRGLRNGVWRVPVA